MNEFFMAREAGRMASSLISLFPWFPSVKNVHAGA
jgi:hypothetical protein